MRFWAKAAAGIWVGALLTPGVTTAAGLDDPLVAEGKLLYEETAGDVGCALCHGLDATGDADAGGVYIQGVLVSTMDAALKGGVPEMSDLFNLKRHEVDAIQAYLDHLYTREEAQVDPVAFPGKVIFDETAGGVGCASCHQEDATGDVGPNIQGRTENDVRMALDSVEDMGFIELTNEEIGQVSIYLGYLLEASGH